MNVVGMSAPCVSVGGWINRPGFRLDVMMRGRKQWRISSPTTPAVNTVNIWKWERDGGVFTHLFHVCVYIYAHYNDSYGVIDQPR